MWILKVLDQSRWNITPSQTKFIDDGKVTEDPDLSCSLGQLGVALAAYLIT